MSTVRTESRLARLAPLTGVVFVALWIAAFVAGLGGEENPSNAEILAYYAEEGNRGADTMLMFLVLAASVAFLVFVTVLRDRLAPGSTRTDPLSSLVLGAGFIATSLWIVTAVFWGGIAYTANETPAFEVDPNTERLVGEMAYLFFVTGVFSALPLVLATSLIAGRTGVLPRWLAWLGLLVAVTMLGALAVLPFFFFVGWTLLVSVVLLLRHPGRVTAPAAPVESGT